MWIIVYDTDATTDWCWRPGHRCNAVLDRCPAKLVTVSFLVKSKWAEWQYPNTNTSHHTLNLNIHSYKYVDVYSIWIHKSSASIIGCNWSILVSFRKFRNPLTIAHHYGETFNLISQFFGSLTLLAPLLCLQSFHEAQTRHISKTWAELN